MKRTFIIASSVIGLSAFLPAPARQPVIDTIVAEVSEARIEEVLRKLEGFGTRYTFSDTESETGGTGAARRFIKSWLEKEAPRLRLSLDTYHVKKQGGRLIRDADLVNVVGTLPGRDPGRWLIVSGHYDTLSRSDASTPDVNRPAPGVNDDGSGTAAVMELARVFSRHDFDASIAFIAFDGEELGLVGSSLYSQRAKREGMRVDAVLNNDIIGNDVGGDGFIDNSSVNCFSEGPEDSPSREVARYVKATGERYVPSMEVRLVFRHDRFGRGGDHTPFNLEGYAAVRMTVSRENYANQHTATDTFAGVSVPYLTRVARVNAAALASLALGPSAPTVTSETGALLLDRGASGYDAWLRWRLPNSPDDLAGYAVVMRETTSPTWQKELWVGSATELVLPNVSIDVHTFGVKAVDRDGNESLVTPYVTAPRRRAVYETY